MATNSQALLIHARHLLNNDIDIIFDKGIHSHDGYVLLCYSCNVAGMDDAYGTFGECEMIPDDLCEFINHWKEFYHFNMDDIKYVMVDTTEFGIHSIVMVSDGREHIVLTHTDSDADIKCQTYQWK